MICSILKGREKERERVGVRGGGVWSETYKEREGEPIPFSCKTHECIYVVPIQVGKQAGIQAGR